MFQGGENHLQCYWKGSIPLRSTKLLSSVTATYQSLILIILVRAVPAIQKKSVRLRGLGHRIFIPAIRVRVPYRLQGSLV